MRNREEAHMIFENFLVVSTKSIININLSMVVYLEIYESDIRLLLLNYYSIIYLYWRGTKPGLVGLIRQINDYSAPLYLFLLYADFFIFPKFESATQMSCPCHILLLSMLLRDSRIDTNSAQKLPNFQIFLKLTTENGRCGEMSI